MAARAIVGILLGIIMAPILFLLVYMHMFGYFGDVFWTTFSPSFLDGVMKFATWGTWSTVAPIVGTNYVSLIEGFGPTGSLLGIGVNGPGFIAMYGPSLLIWGVIGLWAGAIERSPTRGLGVGAGCWLGWLIIGLIMWFINPITAVSAMIGPAPFQTNMALALDPMMVGAGVIAIMDLILAQILTLVVVVVGAVLVGVITKSEEF